MFFVPFVLILVIQIALTVYKSKRVKKLSIIDITTTTLLTLFIIVCQHSLFLMVIRRFSYYRNPVDLSLLNRWEVATYICISVSMFVYLLCKEKFVSVIAVSLLVICSLSFSVSYLKTYEAPVNDLVKFQIINDFEGCELLLNGVSCGTMPCSIEVSKLRELANLRVEKKSSFWTDELKSPELFGKIFCDIKYKDVFLPTSGIGGNYTNVNRGKDLSVDLMISTGIPEVKSLISYLAINDFEIGDEWIDSASTYGLFILNKIESQYLRINPHFPLINFNRENFITKIYKPLLYRIYNIHDEMSKKDVALVMDKLQVFVDRGYPNKYRVYYLLESVIDKVDIDPILDRTIDKILSGDREFLKGFDASGYIDQFSFNFSNFDLSCLKVWIEKKQDESLYRKLLAAFIKSGANPLYIESFNRHYHSRYALMKLKSNGTIYANNEARDLIKYVPIIGGVYWSRPRVNQFLWDVMLSNDENCVEFCNEHEIQIFNLVKALGRWNYMGGFTVAGIEKHSFLSKNWKRFLKAFKIHGQKSLLHGYIQGLVYLDEKGFEEEEVKLLLKKSLNLLSKDELYECPSGWGLDTRLIDSIKLEITQEKYQYDSGFVELITKNVEQNKQKLNESFFFGGKNLGKNYLEQLKPYIDDKSSNRNYEAKEIIEKLDKVKGGTPRDWSLNAFLKREGGWQKRRTR